MYRRRWLVIGAWVVILIVAFSQARQVGSVLGPGDFTLPGSDSWKASQILQNTFHQADNQISLVVLDSPESTIHDLSLTRAVDGLAARIRAYRPLRVRYLDNPVVSHNQQLIGANGHAVALLVSSGLKEADVESQVDHLRSLVRLQGFRSWVTGSPASNHDYAIASQKDLARGDAITVPILIIILLLVFGTLVAAGIPFVLAVCSIAVSLALVYWFAHYITASVYVENVVEVLGLGVSIDYSLFIVYRFREELAAAGGNSELAIVRTMQTTGRAVFFSGLTVAIGLSSLILTNLSFMESMGLGGMVVPLSALLVAMTLLPALLGALGTNINRIDLAAALGRLLRRLGGNARSTARGGFWHGLTTAIMRRPIIWGGSALLLLLALAFPVTQLNLAYGGLKNAPKDVESIAGYLYMRSHFPSTPDPTLVLVQHEGPGTVLSHHDVAGMQALEKTLRRNPEATKVIGPADFVDATGSLTPAARRSVVGRYVSADLRTAMIQVVPRHEVGTKANEDMVRLIRKEAPGFAAGVLRGDSILVGGATAGYIDFDDAMYSKFPLIVALVLGLTLIFLFFAFRSVFLPIKAITLNLLSVAAAYGVLQLVFQRGVAHQALGFVPEDGIAPWVPIFLFAFLFGLSMDYEVFLLSRIREAWLRTGNNRASVAFGLEKTGRLISSAAAIMVVAFSSFQVGHEIQLREFGFGLMASVAIDATLIRVILVPSIMELMGKWNWWVPSRFEAFATRGSTAGQDQPVADEELEPVTS
jgi:putative drug exporter of the RND superfamily